MTRLPRLLPVLVLCLLGAGPTAAASAAKKPKPTYPSVAKVSPLQLGVGDTMTVQGKNFRSGTGRNTVVFKRDGGRAVFVKAGKATRTRISVRIPAKLLTALSQKSGKPVVTRFRVRVLAGRFGRRYTGLKGSPSIGATARAVGVKADDCDGDLVPNTKDADDDNDLLSDTLEATLKTDGCKRDSDGDGMSDGWEHESAIDYNGQSRPAPLRRPYPNALDPKDGGVDSDGDGLTNVLEYVAWATFGANKAELNYSGGNPATGGKLRPTAGREWADRDGNGFLSDNERDADGDGIPNQDETGLDPLPVQLNVVGFLADAYIALPEVRKVVDFVPLYGPLEYVNKVQGTGWLDADSDGDGVRDADDDQDGDGVPNLAEMLAELGAGPKDKLQRPLNACEPNLDSRMCIVGDDDIDNDGLVNRSDDDDDGDGLDDGPLDGRPDERDYGLNPFKADTDGDGVGDGYEFRSAIDLNSTAVPYPSKRPYPNPLDGQDVNEDYDGDGLTLSDEYRAWRFDRSPPPLRYSDDKLLSDADDKLLSYSDGTLYTGGRGAAVTDDNRRYDTDGSGYLSDDERDVDGDKLTNWDEAHGRMTPKWWELTFTAFVSTNNGNGIDQIKESVYPGRDFLATSFVDKDTDGDTIWDGDDDEDHDGFTNAFEVERPSWVADQSTADPTDARCTVPGPGRVSYDTCDWEVTYVSTSHSGGVLPNPKARVNPFNPCKPFYSSTCHRYPPFDYYQDVEDWESPERRDGP